MREKRLTCPFTGCEFTAMVDCEGNMYAIHPITGDMNKINYNRSIKKYNVQTQLFKHIETVTLTEAAELLEVSRQRISTIAKDGTIPPKTVNGQTVFILSDVLKYRDERKVGAPRKNQEALNGS